MVAPTGHIDVGIKGLRHISGDVALCAVDFCYYVLMVQEVNSIKCIGVTQSTEVSQRVLL